MKKLLLSLGTATAIVAPVTSVVACDKKDSIESISISFPEKVGEHTIASHMNLMDSDPDALISAFTQLQENEESSTPTELNDIQNELSNMQSKFEGKSTSESLKLFQKTIQDVLNVLYKYAKIHETISVTYNNKTVDTIVSYDASTLFDGLKDGFSDINENNIQQKMEAIASAMNKRLPLTINSLVSQLQNNASIIAWASDAGLSVEDAVFMREGFVDFKLGDSPSDISNNIRKVASQQMAW